jgi:hypothetical protein
MLFFIYLSRFLRSAVFDEFLHAPVKGSFGLWAEKARGKLAAGAVVGDALTANTLSWAGLVGARASFQVLLFPALAHRKGTYSKSI